MRCSWPTARTSSASTSPSGPREKEWKGEKLQHVVRDHRRPHHLQPAPSRRIWALSNRGENATDDQFFDYEIDRGLRQEAAAARSSTARIKQHGVTRAAEVLDDIKATGLSSSPPAARITVSVADMTVPETKYTLIADDGEAQSSTSRTSTTWASCHERRALYAGRARSGRRPPTTSPRRPDREPGQVQPHLHDGRLRRPRLHQADPSAGRYARPDGQHRRVRPSRSPSRPTSARACPFWSTSSPPAAPARVWPIRPCVPPTPAT